MTRMHWLLALPIIVTLLAAVAAQPPGPPPATAPTLDPRVDALLGRWEKESSRVQTMALDVTCTRYNKVFEKTETLVGYAKFMKQPSGDYLATVKLENPKDPKRYERYVCTGTAIYVFRPEEKLIYVYNVPASQAGKKPDDGALPFLFGMRADTAKKRYQMKLWKEPNEWYTYVEIFPNYARDQADFTYARLAILNRDAPNYVRDLPKEVFWVEPNLVQVTWAITKLQRDVPGSVDRNEFVKPQLPAGWQYKFEASTAQPDSPAKPPSIIRPQDDK